MDPRRFRYYYQQMRVRLPQWRPNLARSEAGAAPPLEGPPVDSAGRRYTYLRVSLIDRCNLRCGYCMPDGGEKVDSKYAERLTDDEVVQIVQHFAGRGLQRVRLTGGEPLVRKGVVALTSRIAELVPQVVMTTNATRLRELAAPLKDAGLAGLNISLDSIDPARFAELTGGDLHNVLDGIEAAREVGLPIKINAVAIRSAMVDGGARRLVEYAWSIGATPRFIELMPLGNAAIGPEERITASELRAELQDLLADSVDAPAHHGPARYKRSHDGAHRCGFITAMSEHFCDSCNRLRITSTGELRTCLASTAGVSLRDLLRSGADDDMLARAVDGALAIKPSGHFFDSQSEGDHGNVAMSIIGG